VLQDDSRLHRLALPRRKRKQLGYPIGRQHVRPALLGLLCEAYPTGLRSGVGKVAALVCEGLQGAEVKAGENIRLLQVRERKQALVSRRHQARQVRAGDLLRSSGRHLLSGGVLHDIRQNGRGGALNEVAGVADLQHEAEATRQRPALAAPHEGPLFRTSPKEG